MRQLISRPTIYTVIGLGVSALLFSQMRSGEPLASNQVSATDPFKSLGDLSGKDLMGSISETPAMVEGIQRDAATALKSIAPKLSESLPQMEEMAAPIQDLATPIQDLATELSAFPETAAEAVTELVAPINNELSKLEFDETDFPAFGDENTAPVNVVTTERYELEQPSSDVQEIAPEVVSEMATMKLVDEMTQEAVKDDSSAAANSIGRVINDPTNQPRGWRKNPFMSETNDVVVSEPMIDMEPANQGSVNVDETSSFEPQPNFDDMVVEEGTTILEDNEIDNQFLMQFDGPEQIAPVGNFEPRDAGSSVALIPSDTTEMQSVVIQPQQGMQTVGDLPTVIGLPDSVAHKAVHNIEYGKSLSRRGAAYAARQEFLRCPANSRSGPRLASRRNSLHTSTTRRNHRSQGS